MRRCTDFPSKPVQQDPVPANGPRISCRMPKRSVTEQVALKLAAEIAGGKLLDRHGSTPSQRLPSDLAIAERFEVSPRTAANVRHALLLMGAVAVGAGGDLVTPEKPNAPPDGEAL